MRIVEQRDATPEELEIDEVNTSIYCFRRSLLAPALRRIEPDNSQGEYYLTDVVEVLAAAGHPVEAVAVADPAETQGINDRLQLAAAEGELRRRTNEALLRSGVTMVDPSDRLCRHDRAARTRRHPVPRRHPPGPTVVGDGTELGPNTRLVDSEVGADCVVEQTTARNARIGDRSRSARTPCSHRAPRFRQTRSPGRSTLRSPGSDERPQASPAGEAHGGAGHQEATDDRRRVG